MLSVGTTTLVSHAAGRKDRERAIFAANQSQGLGIACGLLFLVSGMALREQYASALSADTETRRLAADYLLWFIPAMALQFPMVSMSAALRGTGNFKPGMIVQTSTVIINIIAAPLLIFGIGTGRPLGVKGAALASFVALIIGTAWLALYFRGTTAYLHFRPREWKPQMREWAGMLKVGLPAGAEFALMSVFLFVVYSRELSAPPARIPPAPVVGGRSQSSESGRENRDLTPAAELVARPLDRIAIRDHRSGMRITPLLLAIVVVVAVGGSAHSQRRGGGSATLAIVVTDPGGAPISNALVTVEGAAERSARTEQGRIAFENIPSGSYRLRFERDAFVTLERELVARAGAPTEVKVTLNPVAPVKPVPCVEPPATAPVVVTPMAIDLLDFIEKNYVGRDPAKTSSISCTPGGTASLIQVREPFEAPAHANADEFIYVIAGTGAVRIGDRVETLQSGVLMLVPRTMPHVLTSRGRNPLVVLSIRGGERCAVQPAQ